MVCAKAALANALLSAITDTTAMSLGRIFAYSRDGRDTIAAQRLYLVAHIPKAAAEQIRSFRAAQRSCAPGSLYAAFTHPHGRAVQPGYGSLMPNRRFPPAALVDRRKLRLLHRAGSQQASVGVCLL